MSASLSVANDLAEVADALQAVTLRRRGSDQATTIPHALRGAATRGEVEASDGQVHAADVVWHWPVAELAEAPRLGDLVVDAAGTRWTVLEVGQATVGTRWRCHTRNLLVSAGLDALVTIERAELVKGEAGALEPRWAAEWAGVRARIQPQQAQTRVDHAELRTERHYRITVAEELPVDSTHRVAAADGSTFRIVGWERSQRIDQLPVLLAERTAGPS